jgi:hypothetical protein
MDTIFYFQFCHKHLKNYETLAPKVRKPLENVNPLALMN